LRNAALKDSHQTGREQTRSLPVIKPTGRLSTKSIIGLPHIYMTLSIYDLR